MDDIRVRADLPSLAYKVCRLYLRSFGSLVMVLLIAKILSSNINQVSGQLLPYNLTHNDSVKEVTLKVNPGESFSVMMAKHNISDYQVSQILSVASSAYDLRRLKVGQQFKMIVQQTDEGVMVQSLAFKLNNNRNLEIYNEDGTFKLKEIFIPLKKEIRKLSAVINSSILGAAAKAGIPESALKEAITAYSYSIDFQRDIQPNDRLNVLMETYTTEDGTFSHHGKIIYSSLTVGGVEHKIYRYMLGDSEEFISDDYSTMRRSLLKTPVPVTKISSSFGMRKHPILGFSKMHKGVDFSAPVGTPVYAAGNGTVVEVGWKGAYGRYVRIKHNGELSTAYAHLNSFIGGLTKGSKIKQGQVIAYVGATGSATGAHLHYEVLVNGKHINPLSIKSAPVKKLTGSDLAKFKSHKNHIDALVGQKA